MGRGFCDERHNAAPDCVRPEADRRAQVDEQPDGDLGEPTAVVPAALAGVFDEGGVSSDRKPAMSGRSKGVALASGVKCRAYGVRTAA